MRKTSRLIGFYVNEIDKLIPKITSPKTDTGKLKSDVECLSDITSALIMIFVLMFILFAMPVLGVIAFILWVGTWVSLNATYLLGLLSLLYLGWYAITEKSKKKVPVMVDKIDDGLDIAIHLICPVLKLVLKRDYTPELLYYFGQAIYGDGYYYTLEPPVEDLNQCKMIERKLMRRLSELTGRDLKFIIENREVIVRGHMIFVRRWR